MRGEFALDQIHMRNHAEKLTFFLLHFLEHNDRFLEHLGIERSKAFVKENGINAHVATGECRNSKRKLEAHEESFATRYIVNRAHGIAVVMIDKLDVERIRRRYHFIPREHIAQIAIRNF